MGPRGHRVHRHALGVLVSTQSDTYLAPATNEESVSSAVNQVSAVVNRLLKGFANHKLSGALSPKARGSLKRTSVQIDALIEGVLQLKFRALCPEGHLPLRI